MLKNIDWKAAGIRMARHLRNKYVLLLVVAVGWMVFFDQYDLRSLWKLNAKVAKLEEVKAEYEQNIARVKRETQLLTANMDAIERYAREQFYMKKASEDIYVIIEGEE